ncbi:MAG: hypothetical protein NVS1B11_19910 [Terriglobales bacterium]
MTRFLGVLKFHMLCLAAVVLLGGMIAWAAITGTISGIITDPSGAVVPGVTVIVINKATGAQSTATTDDRGFYSFPSLAIGNYDLTSSHDGFRNFQENGVLINVNSAVRIDIKLQLGGVTNTVTVNSDTLQIETQNTQLGDVIEAPKIVAMPLNGRSYLGLLALEPGVSPITGYSSTNGYSASPGVSGNLNPGTESIAGGRPGTNGFMVNGADAEEGVQNVAAIIPNLDSIAEFRVITNNFNAEYGNFSGGQVNVVTKSGANQFHGNIFEFLRNTAFDAKNYFATERGQLKQNTFGGTFGGPIKHNKLFFFGDYQGTRRIEGLAAFFPVPSTADRTGNLIDVASSLQASDPANGGQGVVGAYWANLLSQRLGYAVMPGEPYYSAGCTSNATCVFPNAVIPQAAWDPVAVNTLKYIPLPNTIKDGIPYYQTTAFNGTINDDKGAIRLDGNTRYGNLFGYYFIDDYHRINPYGTSIPGFAQGIQGRAQMVNLGLTTTFGNSMVNDIRLVYLRNVNTGGIGIGGEKVSLASLGFNTPWNNTGGIGAVDPKQEGVPLMAFNNYVFGASAGAQVQRNNTYQIIDNVTKIVGTHSIQFGADLHYDQINEFYGAGIGNGFFGFSGSETGLDFADYLLGAVAGFAQSGQSRLDSRSKYVGLYAQDSWRATHTLTLNYGLRWEVSTPWYDTQNKIETLIPGHQSLAFPTAPLGLVVPGDPGVPKTLSKVQYNRFAPRVGFAYSPDVTSGWLGKIVGGPGKTSIRAGYGIFYQTFADVQTFSNEGSAPYGEGWGSPVPPLLNSPYIDRATGNFEGIKFPFTFPPPGVSPKHPDSSYNWAQAEPLSGRYFASNNVMPYVEQYELSLQRQLGKNTVLTAGYVGTVGRHLMTLKEANPGDQALCLFLMNPANVAPGTPTCGPNGEQGTYITASGQTINGTRKPFGSQNFSSNAYMTTSASSNYNSLQLSLRHQEKYAEFLISYTFMKALSNANDDFDQTNPINPRLSYGLSLADVPQDLVISYTVQLPFDKLVGRGAVARGIAGGWSLSGITTFASGAPVQIKETDDRSLIGATTTIIDTPSFANNGTSLFLDRNPRHNKPYFNPNFFTLEPLGQFGNVRPEFFNGPGVDNYDMALTKDTNISERWKLQFRAEAFNVFNHASFGGPDGNINNTGPGGFGYVTSAGDPRIMQLALKLLF